MANHPKIRVLIVDDHAIVRKGLNTFLMCQPDIQVVGEAGDGREAIGACEELCPDVVLLDLVMPEMGGVAASQVIHQRWPRVQIIILTSFQEKKLIQDALNAGAIGYLLKNVAGEELSQAIYRAYAGRPTLAAEVVRALVGPEPAAQPPVEALTVRELEVLALLAKGIRNPEIAERLVISRTTVKSHISNILAKLGTSSRCEAVTFAIQHRLLPTDWSTDF